MVPVGDAPILLHVMKYYAYHGHTDFVLCLGYKAGVIRDYFFRNRDDPFVRKFVLCDGTRTAITGRNDSDAWRITFVDTGLHANIGQRLKAVQALLGEDELFLANYSDVLTDAPLPEMVANVLERGKLASFVAVRPNYSFHIVSYGDGAIVRDIRALAQSDVWINGGYFVFRREIFEHLHEGEELVEQPFRRLIADEALLAYRHEGFWAPMDTFKDRQLLESLVQAGPPPWTLWEPAPGEQASLAAAGASPTSAA
jgi:glucose-1-phosphate cytidylyltransferase